MNARRWALAALALGAALAIGVPRLARALDYFRVDRIAVVGTRHMEPREVLEASGITARSSVFDDTGEWRRRLLAHPLIRAADIDRRPPDALVLTITETRPVALVQTPVLRAVGPEGRVLPIEPAGTTLDLPIISVPADSAAVGRRLRDSVALALVRFTRRLRRRAPRLADRVSQLETGPSGGIRLRLRRPLGVEVRLAAVPARHRLRRVQRVLRDLAARGDLDRLEAIDARFRGQVVAQMTSGAGG